MTTESLSITLAGKELDQSIEIWTVATTDQSLLRAKDITRDKSRAVRSFFELVEKQPDEINSQDVLTWRKFLQKEKLSERYIYASLSHLSSYFEWLRKTELGAFLKINPVRSSMPKPPKKYNSPKAKSLTDEELTKLRLYVENQAADDKNTIAVRDYAIFRFFTATGMRREEVINLGMEDLRIEENQILIHTRVKGGNYEWRTINDEEVGEVLMRYLKLAKRKSLIGQKGRALWIRFDRDEKSIENIAGTLRENKEDSPYHKYMPPLVGTDDEVKSLVKYLQSLTVSPHKNSTVQIKSETAEVK